MIKDILSKKSSSEWKDWKWQERNVINITPELSKYFVNVPKSFFEEISTKRLRLKITPYMLSKMDPKMNVKELQKNSWFQQFFPLGKIYEKGYDAFDGTENWDLEGEFPTKILQHKYTNRVLLYSPICLAYCNFCFKANEQLDTNCKMTKLWNEKEWKKSLKYIKETPEIEELVFSGGDPLVLSDSKLDEIFSDLSKIKNKKGEEKIYLKRIHTRALTHNPYRITKEFVNVLKKHKINQLIFNIAHPDEITKEFVEAIYKIRKFIGGQGIILAMHTPYLKNVNDNEKILWELFSKAAKNNIKAYYLIATFPHTPFADVQRASVKEMMEIMHKIRRKKSIAQLPTPIVAHPQRKIILPYYKIEKIKIKDNPFLKATELSEDDPQTYLYPDKE